MTSLLDNKTLSWQDRAVRHWNNIRPVALALGLGLIAGPLISNYMGWQMTRGNAERQINASGVQQQAMVCAALARNANPDAASLGWAPRNELAEKFAVMPGRDSAAMGVANACSQMLAEAKS